MGPGMGGLRSSSPKVWDALNKFSVQKWLDMANFYIVLSFLGEHHSFRHINATQGKYLEHYFIQPVSTITGFLEGPWIPITSTWLIGESSLG